MSLVAQQTSVLSDPDELVLLSQSQKFFPGRCDGKTLVAWSQKKGLRTRKLRGKLYTTRQWAEDFLDRRDAALDALELGPPLADPPCPTACLPGSAEKVEVMRARSAAGYQAFHRDDAW